MRRRRKEEKKSENSKSDWVNNQLLKKNPWKRKCHVCSISPRQQTWVCMFLQLWECTPLRSIDFIAILEHTQPNTYTWTPNLVSRICQELRSLSNCQHIGAPSSHTFCNICCADFVELWLLHLFNCAICCVIRSNCYLFLQESESLCQEFLEMVVLWVWCIVSLCLVCDSHYNNCLQCLNTSCKSHNFRHQPAKSNQTWQHLKDKLCMLWK